MSYVQLTSEERYVIYHLKLFKLSLREIARRLGIHHLIFNRLVYTVVWTKFSLREMT